MTIYGRAKRTCDDDLLEMSEVTFHVPMADLRRIARFLNDAADQVEQRLTKNNHVHLIDFDREWSKDHPKSDVIVIHPAIE
ncbi:MAG: hypothetical protein U0894_06690 [Pirellulales bacterium]